MPPVVIGHNGGSRNTQDLSHLPDEGYDYPMGKNLKPGSKLHDRVVKKLFEKVWEGKRYMEQYYDEWREMDQLLQVFVREDFVRNGEGDKLDDNDRLAKIVMPDTYANLEVLMTYMSAAFWRTPMFDYAGRGPEDQLGGLLMTQLIAQQAQRGQYGLAVHTLWRDAFAYGFGAIHAYWDQVWARRPKKEESGFYNAESNSFIVTEQRKRTERRIVHEGSRLDNPDPYRFFADPSVPIHQVRDALWHGWLSDETYTGLLGEERQRDSFFFNVKYLKTLDNRSNLARHLYGTKEEWDKFRDRHTNHVDVMWIYATIIPNDWGLGSKTFPEKWLFALAGDKVLIAAEPLDLYYDGPPLVVIAPEFDGHNFLPSSRLAVTRDMQMLIDFLYRSHIANVRRAVNDTIVYDPTIINGYDLKNLQPGGRVRTRKSTWGRAGVKEFIFQLAVQDVTQQHVGEAAQLSGRMQNTVGATDNVSGVVPRRGERISAAETMGARSSSLNRLERLAKIGSEQGLQPLAHILAAHTQQFMERETYVEIVGEYEERLRKDFGVDIEDNRTLVNPMDLAIDYDLKPLDGTIPGSQDANMWIQMLQVAGQSPEVMQTLDLPRLITHIARHLGATNFDDFVRKGGAQPPQVLPAEQVQQQQQAGNLVPAGEAL